MATIYHKGQAVKRSKNLRGIIEYARQTSDVAEITVERLTNPDKGTFYPVTFIFRNGAECSVDWADWRVLVRWIKARRSWDTSVIIYRGLPEFVEAMA